MEQLSTGFPANHEYDLHFASLTSEALVLVGGRIFSATLSGAISAALVLIYIVAVRPLPMTGDYVFAHGFCLSLSFVGLLMTFHFLRRRERLSADRASNEVRYQCQISGVRFGWTIPFSEIVRVSPHLDQDGYGDEIWRLALETKCGDRVHFSPARFSEIPRRQTAKIHQLQARIASFLACPVEAEKTI
ncbi:hypothetical protein [Parvularcula bermudensis]|uniref:hypothetical protein n=1 Tax=Parvularcula bermudensis TaxID=208216 RepID=UPI0011D1A84D|nr:hypothetical protein [Parvularcula bermudensis]